MTKYIIKGSSFFVLDYFEHTATARHYNFSRFIKRKKFNPLDIYTFWRHFTLCSCFSLNSTIQEIYTEDNGWRELRPGDSYDG